MILTYKPTRSRIGLVCRESEVEDGEVYRCLFREDHYPDTHLVDLRKGQGHTFKREGLDAMSMDENPIWGDRTILNHFSSGNLRYINRWVVRIRRCE
jgi:hypothetical protein